MELPKSSLLERILHQLCSRLSNFGRKKVAPLAEEELSEIGSLEDEVVKAESVPPSRSIKVPANFIFKPVIDANNDLFSPDLFEQYEDEIIEKLQLTKPLVYIKRGGYGHVYSAEDRAEDGTSRPIAVKGIFASRTQQSSSYPLLFQLISFSQDVHSELEMLRLLKHPNIVTVIRDVELIHEESQLPIALFFSMEHMQYSMHDIIKMANQQLLTLVHFKSFIIQIASAIDYMHRLQIAHHDIKPPNIMVNLSALVVALAEALIWPGNVFKVIDFGLAQHYSFKSNDPTAVCSEPVGGTRFLLPPERPDPWNARKPFNPYLSDSYALGMTILMALFGVDKLDQVLEEGKSMHTFWNEQFMFLCPIGKQIPSGSSVESLLEFEDRLLDAFEAVSSLLEPNPLRRAFINESFIKKFDF